MLIQQLQDEIAQLRQRLKVQCGDEHVTFNTADATARDPALRSMQLKLKQAARDIRQLAADKQQLIEIGNRLRAELHQLSTFTRITAF